MKPGESSVIAIEATPPGEGERTIEIEIATNAGRQGNIHLRLTMVGKHPLPYVAISSGPVQFGFIQEPHGARYLLGRRTAEDRR